MSQLALPTTEKLYELVREAEITQLPGSEQIWLANDTVQSIGSFKLRGALHAMQQAVERDSSMLENGVFTASAGNAAQGVALAATYLGLTSRIFLPQNAPVAKVEAVELFGGVVTRVPGTVDDALHEAQSACQEKQGYFVHPFDNFDVIEGQGSLGHEIARSPVQFDSVFVPVGGGGLLAGMCRAFAEHSLDTKVFGVQLEDCDAFTQSVSVGEVVELEHVSTLADGTAVKRAGELTLRLTLESPNFGGMVTVCNQELGSALVELDRKTNITAETAAGLSFAGLKKYRLNNPAIDQKSLAVITGKHRDNKRFSQLFNS